MPMLFLRGDALSPTRASLDASRLAVWARSRGVPCALPDVFVVPHALTWALSSLLAPSVTELARPWPCRLGGYEVRGIERVAQHTCAPRGEPMWPSVAKRVVAPAERVELVLDLVPLPYDLTPSRPRVVDRALLAAQHVELHITPRGDGSASCSVVLPSSPWQNLPLAFEALDEERRAASVFCRLHEQACGSLDALSAICALAPDAPIGPDDTTLHAPLATLTRTLDALHERYSRFRYATPESVGTTLDALLATCAFELLRAWPRDDRPSASNTFAVEAPATPVRIDGPTADRLHAIVRWVRLARELSGDESPLTLGGSVLDDARSPQLIFWFRSNERAPAWCTDVAMRAAEDEVRHAGGAFESGICGGEVHVRFTLPL